MMRRDAGISLLELMSVIAILTVLFSLGGVGSLKFVQKSKVSAANAQLSAWATALEMVKADTEYYPLTLSDSKSASALNGIPGTLWRGPYAERVPRKDPWGNSYFYSIAEGNVLDPVEPVRETGPPQEWSYSFTTIASQATLIMDNIANINHAGRIWLNGVEIVSPNEFKNDLPQVLKSVNLQANNTLTIRLESNPGTFVRVRITGALTTTSTFTLGSYGSDGLPGGEGSDADIIFGTF